MMQRLVNRRFLTYLVCTQLCFISSIAFTNDFINYFSIPETTINTISDDEQQLLSKEDEASFENKLIEVLSTVDYFSNNYPYTVEQLKNYYQIDFKDNEINGLSLKPTYDSNKIFDIDIRNGSLDSQSLLITISQSVCFNYKQLRQRLLEEGYELNPSSVYYFANFDKVEQIEDTIIKSSITVNRDKNIDIGCIEYYFFEHLRTSI